MTRGIIAATLLSLFAVAGSSGSRSRHWVGTWATSPQLWSDATAPIARSFADGTLRQIVHVSLGGKQLRLRFSNAFGSSALTIQSVHVAISKGQSRVDSTSDKELTFHGRSSATISPNALAISDPIDFDLAPLSDLAVTIYLPGVPDEITMHRYSMTTSYLQSGKAVTASDMPSASQLDHWYFLTGVEILADRGSGSIVALGDSITDGNGSTSSGNARWPDGLARRLRSNKKTSGVGVMNEGIGGNRLLHEHIGRGQNALARLDRDVLAQSGVRWLIVLEGINDIAERVDNESNNPPAAAEELIAGYEQIIARAHSQNILVYGGTILPYEGSSSFSIEGEADRQTVNEWVRSSGKFDGVIDFDAAIRDMQRPSRISPALDRGDHVHPSDLGYKSMYDKIDLRLFER